MKESFFPPSEQQQPDDIFKEDLKKEITENVRKEIRKEIEKRETPDIAEIGGETKTGSTQALRENIGKKRGAAWNEESNRLAADAAERQRQEEFKQWEAVRKFASDWFDAQPQPESPNETVKRLKERSKKTIQESFDKRQEEAEKQMWEMKSKEASNRLNKEEIEKQRRTAAEEKEWGKREQMAEEKFQKMYPEDKYQEPEILLEDEMKESQAGVTEMPKRKKKGTDEDDMRQVG